MFILLSERLNVRPTDGTFSPNRVFTDLVSPNDRMAGSAWARRCEQCLDKPPGLSGVQFNLVAFVNNLAGHCNRMQGDKFGHRAAFDGGGFTEKLFFRRGYPGDESLAFRFFQCRRHT